MPLVTAVCPTFGRPEYVKKAIACFFSQTWAEKELLILDDGPEPCYSVVPVDRGIRYEYGKPGTWPTLGEKRNAMNEMANGEIICHWDDDDWSCPQRMEEQVSGLLEIDEHVVGYYSLYFYRPGDRKAFKYVYSGQNPDRYAVGTSLCYWKKYWSRNRFNPQRVAEDSQFAFRAGTQGELVSIPGLGQMVARTLGNSTPKPNLGDFNFPPVSVSALPPAFFEAENL